MPRQRQPAGTLLGPAVQKTIKSLTLAPEDAGAVQLAHRYAATIDTAATIAAELAEVEVDEDNAKRVAALAAKVDAQTVLDTLGPKLLAVLESLGATPKARSALRKGGPANGGGKQRSPLDELRARRAKRAG